MKEIFSSNEKDQSLCSRNCDDRLHFEVKKCVCSKSTNGCEWVNKGRKCEAEATLSHKNKDFDHRSDIILDAEMDSFGIENSRN